MPTRVRRNPLQRGELVLTRDHFENLRGNKGVGFIRMDPTAFIALTTTGKREFDGIVGEALSLREYVQMGLLTKYPIPALPLPGRRERWRIAVPPFLKVRRYTGKVVGHEGRHRAAAVLSSGKGRKMWVGIVLADENGYATYYDEPAYKVGGPMPMKTYLGAAHIPKVFKGQFAEVAVRVKAKPFIWLWKGR